MVNANQISNTDWTYITWGGYADGFIRTSGNTTYHANDRPSYNLIPYNVSAFDVVTSTWTRDCEVTVNVSFAINLPGTGNPQQPLYSNNEYDVRSMGIVLYRRAGVDTDDIMLSTSFINDNSTAANYLNRLSVFGTANFSVNAGDTYPLLSFYFNLSQIARGSYRPWNADISFAKIEIVIQ